MINQFCDFAYRLYIKKTGTVFVDLNHKFLCSHITILRNTVISETSNETI